MVQTFEQTYVDCRCIHCGWRDGIRADIVKAHPEGLTCAWCDGCDGEAVFKPSFTQRKVPPVKFCLRCWITGHKWWVRQLSESIDDDGRRVTDKTYEALSHCDRCGEPNPRIEEAVAFYEPKRKDPRGIPRMQMAPDGGGK